MAFYQLFIKLMKFNSIGTIIILIVYLFLNNLNMRLSEANVTLLPNNLEIAKIDVGQGDDIWILTTDHTVTYKFFFLRKKIRNFC